MKSWLVVIVGLGWFQPLAGASGDWHARLAGDAAVASKPAPSGVRGAGPQFEVPVPPEALPPVLSVTTTFAFAVPLESGALCPDGAECVFSSGGGVGVQVERRWPFGPAVGLAYELGFVDSNGVFELGLFQELRAQAKYFFLPRSQLHPFIGGGVGAAVFGDTFRVATLGVSLLAFAGAELELTELLSVHLAIPIRAVRFGAFTTERDGIRRATDGGFTVTGAVQVGLTLSEID